MDQSTQLANLLQGYLAGSLSDQEKLLLHHLLEDRENLQQWNRLIGQAYDSVDGNTPQYAEDSAEEREKMVTSILRYTHPEKEWVSPAPVRRMWPLKGWAAAAAIALLFGSAWYLRTNHRDKTETVTNPPHPSLPNDVSPGGNSATLTLGNGQKIVLDHATDGQIAQQGNTTIQKKADGILAYTVNRDNAAGSADDAVSPVRNTLSTPRGGQYQLTLPDGTRVWLNAASSITYPTAFTGREREVYITGEAYFEVAQRAGQPFVVSRGTTVVQVLGTQFNINAYEDEPDTKISLLEGGVKVDHSLVLRPGQQAIVDGSTTRLAKQVDMDEVVSWKNGEFQFGQRADLHTIMRQLARWYDVDVVFRGRGAEGVFGGAISRNSNLSQVLSILQTSGVKFSLEGKKIIVNP